MRITDVRRLRNKGYALLELKINGVKTTISAEQKRTLLLNNIVYAGSEMEDRLSVVFQGDRMRGCSDNAELVELVQEFVGQVYTGTFEAEDISYS